MASNQAAAAKTAPAKTAAPAKAKTFVGFFTREGTKGPVVELFKDVSGTPKAPAFSGKIGNKRVSLFLRRGSKGAFFGLVGAKLTDGSNLSEDLGTANIAVLGNGNPVLVIDYKNADGSKTAIFASVSKKLSNEELVEYGLNLERQEKKRLAAQSAEKPAEQAAA